MKKKLKRILALVLVVAMSLSLMNTPQFTTSVQAAAPADKFTFTFVDGTGENIAKDGAVFKIWADNVEYTVSGGNGTWTANLPINVESIFVGRYNPDDLDNNPWNSWTIYANSRGTETTWTATDWNGGGHWGSTVTPPDPTGDIYGTPLTDTKNDSDKYVSKEINLGQGDLTDVNGNQNKLFSVAAVMYNYTPGGGDGWWNQFYNLNKAMLERYAGDNKITHPLVTGAFNSREGGIVDSTVGAKEGNLKSNTVDLNSQVRMDNKLWYINHNMAGNGSSGDWNASLVNAPLQGLVAPYLSTDGELLSSENNVKMPYFDNDFIKNHARVYGSVEKPITFPFRVADNGYYEFNSGSGQDNVYMGSDGKLVYSSNSNAQIKNLTDNSVGFYPFNTNGTATTESKHLDGKATSNSNLETNYGFGMRLDIPFNVPKRGDEVSLKSNIKEVSLTNRWNTTITNPVTLPTEIKPGQYVVIYNADGENINLDSIDIGDRHYTVTDRVYNTVALVDDGKVAHFQDHPGTYIVYKYNGTEPTTSVDINCRAYGDGFSFYAMALDSYDDAAIKAAVNEVQSNDDVMFNFEGDDDLWVYIDGKLVLDMGGDHGNASGSINFTTGEVIVNGAKTINANDELVEGITKTTEDWIKFAPNEYHQMTVFYMERGLYDSNLKISFNFEPVKLTQENGLTVTNKMNIDKINDTLKDTVKKIMGNDGFHYEVKNATDPSKIPTFDGDATDGKFTFPGDGSATESEKVEHDDGSEPDSIRGNKFTVEQTPDDRFHTSYSIKDIKSEEIKESTSGTKATDGRNEGEDNVWLQNKTVAGAEEPVGVQIDYVNEANASKFTIEKKLEDGATDIVDNAFTFEVKYTEFFGKAVGAYEFLDGSFAGLTYSVVSASDGTPIDGMQNMQLDENSQLTLKAGQKAVFEGIPSKTKIVVTEKNAEATFRKAEVSVSSVGGENSNSIVDNNNIPATIAADGQNAPAYVFVNGDAKRKTLVYYTEILKETNLPLVFDGVDLTEANNIDSYKIVKNADDNNVADIKVGDTKKTLAITTKHVGRDEFTLKLTNTSTNQIEYVDVFVYNYHLNNQVYVLDYGLPVHLLNGANGILGADGKQGYDYDNNLSVNNYDVLANAADKDGLTKLGLVEEAAKFEGVAYSYADSDFVEKVNGVQTKSFAQAKLTADEKDVVYTLNKFMTQVDTFNYAVQVTKDGLNHAAKDASEGTNVMTCNVKVMPANIVYYEDNFAGNEIKEDGTHGIIYSGNVTTEGKSKDDSTQSNDINMQYGYDPTYATQGVGFSNGSAHNLGHGEAAAFEFHGTGFDIMSRANSTTGTIIVSVIDKGTGDTASEIVKNSETGKITVKNRQENMIQSMVVNTYYENGDMYQIPVITWRSKNSDGNFATEAKDYIVTITSYGGTDPSKTVYIDGLRIYNPLKSYISDEQYDKIHEKDAQIKEIKQLIFGEGYKFNYDNPLDSEFVNKAQATLLKSVDDGNTFTYMLSGKTVVEATTRENEASKPIENPIDPRIAADLMTYAIQGPNNELYLSPQYGFGFNATKTSDKATLQIGVKNIKGGTNGRLELEYLTKYNQWANLAFITSATENYYRLDTEMMPVNADRSYRVVLRVRNADGGVDNIMSFTSVKVKGYTLTALSADAFSAGSLDRNISVADIEYYSGIDKQTGNILEDTTVCYTNIKTSTDIDRITVKLSEGGDELKTVRTNYKDVDGKRVWTVKFKAPTTITESFFIKLYDDDANTYSNEFKVSKNGGIQ